MMKEMMKKLRFLPFFGWILLESLFFPYFQLEASQGNITSGEEVSIHLELDKKDPPPTPQKKEKEKTQLLQEKKEKKEKRETKKETKEEKKETKKEIKEEKKETKTLPVVPKKSKPQVALILHGVGLNSSETKKAIDKLSPSITLSFLPYGRTLEKDLAAAKEKGHDTLLSLPMEPLEYPQQDPGPLTLLTGVPERENLQKLEKILLHAKTCVGVCPYLGSRLTGVRTALRPLLKGIKDRGLVFIDTREISRSQVESLAQELSLPMRGAEEMISLSDTHETFIDKLEKLMRIAHEKGSSLGVIEISPYRVEQLAAWEKSLEDKTLELVPVHTLFQDLGKADVSESPPQKGQEGK